MRLAQQLYEGVEVKGHGTIGLITYLRTDSTRIAEEADLCGKSLCKRALWRKLHGVRRTGQKECGKDPGCS